LSAYKRKNAYKKLFSNHPYHKTIDNLGWAAYGQVHGILDFASTANRTSETYAMQIIAFANFTILPCCVTRMDLLHGPMNRPLL